MNAGKRVKIVEGSVAGLSDAEKPLGKGIVECPKCGRRIAPGRRKRPHEGDEECLAQQVTNEYTERDWVQAFNVTQSQIILESGVPFEWALAGVHMEAANRFDDYGRGKTENVPVRHRVGFTPRSVMRVALLMTRIKFPTELRRKALTALWNRPDMLDALEALGRLDGSVRLAIHEACREYDKEHGIAAKPLEYGKDEDE